ncbi:MAG: UbiD family decarboxylase [Chloroflexi bacterium]|nr:UbiD family decarboxylase [Chloroflexota bacterium]
MSYYRDLRDHIKALEESGRLVRVTRPINKDTELHPLVRWQFRGLPEEQRKAFLFENVVDARGKKYSMPVLIASHAASRQVYALGMMCQPDEIMQRWAHAQLHPVAPRMVKSGPVHEEVHVGDKLLQHSGLEEFPIPISTPGFDNAPYLTCANWISKDPETGIRNMGNYRAMVKSPTRTGINCLPPQHIRTHWDKCRKLGKSLQAAIVIGASPAIGFTATVKVPYGVDELSIAGGIAGEPINLVKCKTVDIEVPADAEIVIEGELPTDSMEREAPFGEYSGYMGAECISPYFNVKCITHRHDPIYNAFLSQFPPSESSKLKQIGHEAALFKFLRHDCGLPVLDVCYHEGAGYRPYCVIKIKKTHPSQVWQALNGAVTMAASHKIVIAVDEDIDARDPESVNWALGFRMQPHRDVRIIDGMVAPLDPSVGRPDELGDDPSYPGVHGGSGMLIDATMKWPYPPVALPRKEYMERAMEIWNELGLPGLTPKAPWHGYSLGQWTEENESEAQLAVQGKHYETGKKLSEQRVNLEKP